MKIQHMHNYITCLIVFLFTATLHGQERRFDSNLPEAPQEEFGKLNTVLGLILDNYVDEVNSDQITEAAIVAILEKLDPHSYYIPKEEADDATQRLNGSFFGIGIRFQIMKDTINVVEVIPGGPCEKLGVLPGDKIISIDAETVAGTGIKNNDVREKLMGEKGTKVAIQVKRRNSKTPINFTITRDKIPLNSVDAAYMLTDKIGYIKLNSFSRTTLEEVDQSLAKLKQQGMQDLIFDLQGNGGGLLHAAHYLADEFLSGNKLVVYSEGRTRPRKDLNAGFLNRFEDGRLVILTDESSASASEIVSGAIQDWDRGLIVGRRTFGKGLVQQPIDLADGSQVRITIARYFTPTGRFIQKPYEDHEAYEKDLLTRYERGEYMHLDSIKLPDSLKFKTLIKGRTVYGGGGIMPDVFVPLDTNGVTEGFRSLIRSGSFNSFAFDFVDKQRKQLMAAYPTPEEYATNFKTDKNVIKNFQDYIKKEYPDVKCSESDWKESGELIALRLKALMSQDLYGREGFFKVYNQQNEILQRALQTLEDGTYEKLMK